jgi:NO-binding membrane sensor protein with MHYT domain
MLAFEFDLPIGIDVGFTVLSSFLPVFFTFLALATDLLWDRYQERKRRPHRKSRRSSSHGRKSRSFSQLSKRASASSAPLLDPHDTDDDEDDGLNPTSNPADLESVTLAYASDPQSMSTYAQSSIYRSPSVSSSETSKQVIGIVSTGISPDEEEEAHNNSVMNTTDSRTRTSSDYSLLHPTTSSSSSQGLGSAIGMIYRRGTEPAKNAFTATAALLYFGCTPHNLGKGFLWSLAVTSMHYSGIHALLIPSGYVRFNVWLVILSAIISWTVCTVGCILMAKMETHLPQQILFSIIAAAGVGAMHFTGMSATKFYSTVAASELRGYPPSLANAVVAIAFITCIAANVLLAHSATVSRNKLAEIVWTKKELWKTIALKENAEAAARVRSDFIASASHEIRYVGATVIGRVQLTCLRTPLHHLQGYSDLLAQTELTEEGRSLLTSIQRATKTLSLSRFRQVTQFHMLT